MHLFIRAVSPDEQSSGNARRDEHLPLSRMIIQNNSTLDESNPKKMVVIYTPPGMPGHMFPTVELGKLLVAQGLEVTVVFGGEDDDGSHGAGGSFLAGVAAANPSLSFHSLPRATLPSDVRAGSDEDKILGRACASIPNLRDFLRSAIPAPVALVIDSFCGGALDVGAELGIPTYFFLTTCTACLAFSLHKLDIDEQTTLSFRDLAGVSVRAPGVPPIPIDHLPAFLLDRDSLSAKFFMELPERLCNSQGLIVNSCRSLEPRATDAIVSGLCTYRGRQTPPLYCIGPLIKPEEAGTERHECLAWLDGQPKASVVFLCFGSLGRLSAEQIKQMAAGLETSGQRFLWVVRRPPGDEHRPADDLDALLPKGFLHRTKERGLVVMSWAPQREVLAHGAVGGFVTHCGWNSVLEAVMAGVPMLAWPLYAEQRMNKVFLVEEMQLAVAMEGYDKEMVEAQEVAAKVRWLIGSDGGRELRQRAHAAMRLAKDALDDGGESRTALLHLARDCKNAGDSENYGIIN